MQAIPGGLTLFAGVGRPALSPSLRTLLNPVDGEHELFSFLTTKANAIVTPIHPKAMPVILTAPEEVDLRLESETRPTREFIFCRGCPARYEA